MILWENVFCSVKVPLLVLAVIVQEVSSLAKSFKIFFRVVYVCSYFLRLYWLAQRTCRKLEILWILIVFSTLKSPS